MAKLDQLTQDSIAAQKAGMSYGKYMALQYRQPDFETDVKPETPKRECPVCGKKISKYANGNRRYCSDRCRYEGGKKATLERYHQKKAEANADHERPERVCKVCGIEIPAHMHGSNRYCSPECKHERAKEAYRAKWSKNKDQINARRRSKRSGEI